MTKTLFPPQTFVGFEHLLNELDFIGGRHANDNYPPHNVVKVAEHEFLMGIEGRSVPRFLFTFGIYTL